MSYSVIAPLYDRINGDQYIPYSTYLKEVFARYADIPVKEVLDLGCGTGSIAALLAEEYDMVALDASPEMLSIAMEMRREYFACSLFPSSREGLRSCSTIRAS